MVLVVSVVRFTGMLVKVAETTPLVLITATVPLLVADCQPRLTMDIEMATAFESVVLNSERKGMMLYVPVRGVLVLNHN